MFQNFFNTCRFRISLTSPLVRSLLLVLCKITIELGMRNLTSWHFFCLRGCNRAPAWICNSYVTRLWLVTRSWLWLAYVTRSWLNDSHMWLVHGCDGASAWICNSCETRSLLWLICVTWSWLRWSALTNLCIVCNSLLIVTRSWLNDSQLDSFMAATKRLREATIHARLVRDCDAHMWLVRDCDRVPTRICALFVIRSRLVTRSWLKNVFHND